MSAETNIAVNLRAIAEAVEGNGDRGIVGKILKRAEAAAKGARYELRYRLPRNMSTYERQRVSTVLRGLGFKVSESAEYDFWSTMFDIQRRWILEVSW